MHYLFYFFVIPAILWEAICITSPKKADAFVKRMKSLKHEKMNSNQKSLTFLMFLYCVWLIVGLMTSQWVVFTILILMSFIPKPYWFLRIIDGMVSLALLLFIVINRYHLHIDLFSHISKYL